MHDLQDIVRNTKELTLLYVEDNKEARDSTLNILNEFFPETIVAVDGEDGLRKFKENKIDLIITDINMPKMNGLDMIRAIKELKNDVISLVFSAYNEASYFVDSIKLGIEGYLLKPIDFEQFLSLLYKVTQKIKALESVELLKQYKEIVDNSSIVSILDTEYKILYVNDAFCQISGYSRNELLGQEYHSITNNRQEDRLNTEIWDRVQNEKKIWKGITKNSSKQGKVYYMDSTIKPILDSNGEIVEYIALRYNITDIMNPLKQLNDFIDASIEAMVVLIKIEGFDDIEKFYGQKILQELENSFAQQLLEFIPKDLNLKSIFILRDGEYAIAIDKINCTRNNKEIEKSLLELQQRVELAHVNVGDLDYDISILISYAYGDKVLENAKYGMKKLLDSKQNIIFANNFAEQEYLKALDNIKVLRMVKKAIEDKKIISYFQPIVDNKSKQIVKYESLVRLIDENGKVVSPFFFLDASKKGKYYTQITSIVLDHSFAALSRTDKSISVNLSALDIEKEQISEKFFMLLEKHKDDRKRIVIELLEDENFKNFEVLKGFISKVKSLGVKIAIDDFGSGYSNFERLLDYQPDILKIDASLIQNIATSKFSLSTVKTMVLFAKEQNMEVIAEYVENEEIYDILCTLGVDYSQGYYFGKPELLE